ncbi:hypothetical protein KCMC57_63960 (plasmid) [Kitasatospora sp. CMC57]|uniref:Uncharacterized protein n=1 Tax=Kitasatospora sp. CMC57 TaxID=3231513 RepID=A0AB33KDU8_9ACTN
MLQRNPHPYALDVPAIPATVQGGDTVEHPVLIAGFVPVDDPGPDPEPEAAAPPKTTKPKRPAAAGDDTPEV